MRPQRLTVAEQKIKRAKRRNLRRQLTERYAMFALIFGSESGDQQADIESIACRVFVVQDNDVPGLFTTELETTVFRPDGAGPFPVAVINHGKANGDPRFQRRYRPLVAVRFFLARGYAVVVPMRQGFSKSSGSYIGGGCNVESNGSEQARGRPRPGALRAMPSATSSPELTHGRPDCVGLSTA